MEPLTAPHPLDGMVTRLEHLERQTRAADAERLRVIGAAVAEVTALSDQHELALRSLRAELATALKLGERTIEGLMSFADAVVRHYPTTLTGVAEGVISQHHARIIVEEGAVIGVGDHDPVVVERRRQYEREVLRAACVETPHRLRPIARTLAERWADTPLEVRHERARSCRRVSVVECGDGMADLTAHLPAPEAYAIQDRLTQFARSAERGERIVREHEHEREHEHDNEHDNERDMRSGGSAADASGENTSDHGPVDAGARGEGASDAGVTADGAAADGATADGAAADGATADGAAADGATADGAAEAGASTASGPKRTRDQLRTDIFIDLLLSSDPFELAAGCPAEAVKARIQLIAPIEVSEGRQTDALFGELGGHGPVDIGTIREYAARASHHEKVTANARTGEVLSVEQYRPSEQIRRLIGARDRRCRFPGCRVPVHRCDIDHTIDAANGGPTSTENLAALCRGHHTLKHCTDWRVEQQPGGVLRWRSPTGREHVDYPPGMLAPQLKRVRASRVRFEAQPEPEPGL